MHRYRKTYRLGSLVLLVCFLTTLSGVSAGAGHDCCGNCEVVSQSHLVHMVAEVVSGDCCPGKAACNCTLQSTDDTALPVYSVTRGNATGDGQPTGTAATVFGTIVAPASRPPAAVYRIAGRQPDSAPLYLTYQSFLC